MSHNNDEFERIPLPTPPAWSADLEERRNSRRPRPPIGNVNVEAQRLRTMELVNAHNSEFGIAPTAPLEFTYPSRSRPRQRIGDSFQLIVILQLLLQVTSRLFGLVLVDPTDDDAMSRRAHEVDIYQIEAPELDGDVDDDTNRVDYDEIMAEQEERQRRFQEIRAQQLAVQAELEAERERIREADRVIRARVGQELADRENALRAAEAAREEESRVSRARYLEERAERERAEQVAREAARAEREAQRVAAAEEARIVSARYWEGLRARERAEEAARAEREARIIAEDERRVRGNLEERTREETPAAASRSGVGWNAFAMRRN